MKDRIMAGIVQRIVRLVFRPIYTRKPARKLAKSGPISRKERSK